MKKYQITLKGQVYELDVEEIGGSAPVANKTVSAPATTVAPAATQAPKATPPKAAPKAAPAGAQTVVAPMPGKIMAVNVKQGDSIKRGDIICILEAMKMQNEIMATQEGTVSDVRITVGQVMSTGDVIIVCN